MAPLKTKVISASSQDSKHLVENLLNPTNLRKWCCSKSEIDKDLIVVLGFDVSSKIEHINIGNDGSAFVEITVGRSSWPSNRPFEVLLPTVSLMTPAECKSWINTSKVVLLGKASFRASIAEQKWDRVKVRCHQPFATGKQFGLVFVELRGSDREMETGHLTATHGNTKSDDGCDNFKEIVEKAIYSSRKSFKPSLGMSRTEKCLEKALSKSNTGSREIRKGWSDSALLKSKTSVLKKFQQEVECFLENAKIENQESAQLPELVKNMEKSHGTTLNRAERRVICEIVGKKYNNLSSEKNLETKKDKINFNGKRSKEQKDNSWTFRNGIKSSEPSRPGSGSSRNEKRAVTWPVTPLSSMKNDGSNNHTNRCMQRRSTNVSRSILLYGDDIEGPPNKQTKVEPVTKETSEASTIDESTNTSQTNPACPLCGKSMSPVALEIHTQFCSGKTELDDDSQEDSGPVADNNAGNVGKKDASISSHLAFASACVTSTVQSIPSQPLNFSGGREPQDTRPASRKPKARKHSHSGPVATTAARFTNMTSVVNTAVNLKGKPKGRQKADLPKTCQKFPVSLSTVRSAMLTAAVANAVVAANLKGTSKARKQASSHNGRRYPVSSNAPIAVAASAATTATTGNGKGRPRGRKQVASSHTGPRYPVAATATGAIAMAASLPTAVKAASLTGRPKGKTQVALSQNHHSSLTVTAARSTSVTVAVTPAITTATVKRNPNDWKQPSTNRQCGFVHHAIRVRPPTVTTAAVVPTLPTAVTPATTAPLTIDLTRGVPAATMHSTAAETAMLDSNTPLAYQQAIQNIAVAWPYVLGLPSVENAQCPVCLHEYPTNIIQTHANQCLDLGL
eukprot:gene15775-7074_t